MFFPLSTIPAKFVTIGEDMGHGKGNAWVEAGRVVVSGGERKARAYARAEL